MFGLRLLPTPRAVFVNPLVGLRVKRCNQAGPTSYLSLPITTYWH
jgi:hypothetical protein